MLTWKWRSMYTPPLLDFGILVSAAASQCNQFLSLARPLTLRLVCLAGLGRDICQFLSITSHLPSESSSTKPDPDSRSITTYQQSQDFLTHTSPLHPTSQNEISLYASGLSLPPRNHPRSNNPLRKPSRIVCSGPGHCPGTLSISLEMRGYGDTATVS